MLGIFKTEPEQSITLLEYTGGMVEVQTISRGDLDGPDESG